MAFLQKYRGQSLNVKPSCKVLSWSQLCNLAGKNEVTDRHQTIAKWLKNIGNKCSFFCVSEVSRDAESQGCRESGMPRVRDAESERVERAFLCLDPKYKRAFL